MSGQQLAEGLMGATSGGWEEKAHRGWEVMRSVAKRIAHELRGALTIGDLESIGDEELAILLRLYRPGTCPLEGYLRHHLRLRIRDRARRRCNRPLATPSRDPDAYLADTPTPEHVALARCRHRRLRKALGAIRPDDRQLIVRHYFGRELLSDAARAMGISPHQASRMHRRALRQMAASMNGDG